MQSIISVAHGETRARSKPSTRSTVQVLDRAFAMLECFTFHEDRWRTTDLARRCGLPSATTHRILSVLERLHYVERDRDTREYRLGAAAMRLGQRSVGRSSLRALAYPTLGRLATRTGEASLLCVREAHGHGTTVVLCVGGEPSIAAAISVDATAPWHAGAHSKALLAHAPDREARALLATHLDGITPRTITDAASLRRELAWIRRRGFAISCEEARRGLWGVAMAGRDAVGNAFCTVGLVAPVSRMSHERATRHLQAIRAAVGELEAALPMLHAGVPSPDHADAKVWRASSSLDAASSR